MNTKKPALTEAERRAKRNEYSRAYYAAHKDKMIAAVRKSQAKHAKKAATAKHAIAPKPKSKPKKACAGCQGKAVAKCQKKVAALVLKLAAAKSKVRDIQAELKAAYASAKEARLEAKASK